MKQSKVEILEGGGTSLRIAAALLLYQSAEGHVYATVHDIQQHPVLEESCLIGPGRPASKDALGKFAGAVTNAIAFRGMVPECLLYTAPNVIAWYAAPRRRRVWFACDDEQIGKASAEVLHPGLVFVATAHGWYVFALRDDARPAAATPLYKAPYFNVWESGQICSGNVDLPDSPGPGSIPAYETAFFRSRFTHPNDARLVRYKGGATALWRDQLQRPDRQLLEPSVLISRKETFEQAINRILTKEKQ